MHNYIKEAILYKLLIYKKRYPNSRYLPIIKLIFFLVRCLFYIPQKNKNIPTRQEIKNINKNNSRHHTSKKTIAFEVAGGLGDYLIAANYINAFRINFKISKENIVIIAKKGFRNFIFDGLTKNIQEHDESNLHALYIKIVRFPEILYSNIQTSIYKNDARLIEWIHRQSEFREKHQKYFKYLPDCDGETALLCTNIKKKRINQPDILNDFHLTEDYTYNELKENHEILNTHNLQKNKFITIHRGVDTDQTNNSTKLWPQEYYNDLIVKLKEIFPEFKIVQLGVSHARCETMKNIDINLVEKTTLPDITTLLKNAYLHIDCEGGLVHLRHALKGGKSVVLFGPTLPEFFGYSENINIRSNSCPFPCEWLVSDWQTTCMRNDQKHICMKSITPDIVIQKIKS